LNAGLPAYKANLDTGHGGTFGATNGGKAAKAALAYLQWQYRNDEKSKAYLLGTGAGTITADNWKVEHKNWT
jgi:hypothetical protein